MDPNAGRRFIEAALLRKKPAEPEPVREKLGHMQFLNLLHNPETGERFNVDRDIGTLHKEQQAYLLSNAPRLINFNGTRTFLNRLAGLLSIADAENLSFESLQSSITAAINDEYAKVNDEPEKSPILVAAIPEWHAAVQSAVKSGNGEALEMLSPLNQHMEITVRRWMEAAAESGNGKLMHYMLNESPQKEVFREFYLSEGNEGKLNPYLKNVLGHGNIEAYEVILKAFSAEQLKELYRANEESLFNKSSTQKVMNLTIKYYPRDLIGTSRKGEKPETYMGCYQADFHLLYNASKSGNADIIEAIFAKYPESYKRQHILEYNSAADLRAAVDSHQRNSIIALAGFITDNMRQTSHTYAYFHNALMLASSSNDVEMFEVLEKNLPPFDVLDERSKQRFISTRVVMDVLAASEADIIKAFKGTNPRDFLPLINKYINSPEALGKIARILPEEYVQYLHSFGVTYCRNPQKRQSLINAAPDEDIKSFAERVLPAVNSNSLYSSKAGAYYSGDRYQLEKPWKIAFGEQPWIKDLPEYDVISKGPEGFDIEMYRKMLHATQTAVELEGSEGAEANAYKLVRLFGSPEIVDKYFRKNPFSQSHQPIHDALLFEMPDSSFDVTSWRQFALREGMGPKAAKLVGLAPNIERGFVLGTPSEGKPSAEWRPAELTRFRQLSLPELLEIASQVAYKDRESNPELAKYCVSMGLSEASFDDANKLLSSELPKKKTPDVHVDGSELGFPGFNFRRMEANHPWNAFIGKMVNCCNYLGGHTDEMARAQIVNEDCSLYVLTDKNDRPVAKCTGWMSENGNLVFNAWERLSPSCDKFCEPFLLAASVQVLESNKSIQRVTLGTNKAGAPFALVDKPEVPRQEKTASQDSNVQYEVASRVRLEAIKQALPEIAARKSALKKPPVRGIESRLGRDAAELRPQNASSSEWGSRVSASFSSGPSIINRP